MKILNTAQIRQADAYTIENEPISSLDLMERAATACAEWMEENLDMGLGVSQIFCGTGNNGGDGLVIARKLSDKGYPVKVYLVAFSENLSDDCQANLSRLKKLSVEVTTLKSVPESFRLGAGDRIVDAVFGSGLSRPLSGWLKELMQFLNELSGLRIAIDLPSGLFADDNGKNDLEAILKADVTLTFQLPKLAFFLPHSAVYCGDWYVLDIGLMEAFIEEQPSSYFVQEGGELRSHMKVRPRFSHKGTFGHALIMAGSVGKMGASVLSTRACLRSGAGLVTTVTPRCGYDIIQSTVPEAMAILVPGLDYINAVPDDLTRFNALGIGPGLGTAKETKEVLSEILRTYQGHMILDADALNILSLHPEMLRELPPDTILTPHPGEFRRLVGEWNDDLDGLNKLRQFCREFHVITVLKGAYSAICSTEGKVWFNPTGNPGMATGGSGDVLTGIITGLLAQKYDPLIAARLAVFLHGLAADIASLELAEETMVAGDIIRYLSPAFRDLMESDFA